LLIVVDTNVIVSGLLNPNGAPGRILDLIASNVVQLAFDDRVIGEYEEVLTREPFSFSPRQVTALIEHIRMDGTPVSPSPLPQGPYPDDSDLPFAEVALAAEVSVIVTGNAAHFSFLTSQGISVLSPRDFIRQV
jgi:uncharacterized protein